MDEQPQSNATVPSIPLENTQEKIVKENKKSSIPIALIIFGVVGLLLPCLFLIFIVPNMVSLMTELNGNNFGFLYGLPLILVVAIFITQIIYGIHLIREQKQLGGINEKQRIWARLLLVVGVFAGVITIPIIIVSVLNPILGITESLK